ncbi:hypothetical protein Back2_18070 [Nocardioides baekrokdamisoli]|uniref:DUF4429 domain-containing protein n=1 Tax=Nocardioides baekrokdamisoli TaxID=1804624 RepID=A0A3G9IEV1_9ACTN|nr:DUF4429 domain-containing protein [Nocardioides baekrokdamisoli]BBH17520.1 hypothetical protein Back2_18070 [Nocardioides baekrokdamisoli]
MTTVKGYMGSVSFDGTTVILKKSMRGEQIIPLAGIAAVQIEAAGLGMKAIRFSVAGGSAAGTIKAMGNHKKAAEDPFALTFMVTKQAEFRALASEILTAKAASA